MHVDDFIDDRTQDDYARFVLDHFRRPADLRIAFDVFMEKCVLFCTYGGKRWRLVGASTMGDVWLVKDFTRDYGHDERADMAECSDWSDEP